MTSQNSNPKKQLKYIIQHYLSDGKDKNKSVTPEIELRFGTKGVRSISKIDFDNVAKKLLSLDFTTLSDSIYTLKIESEFLDARTGRYQASNVRVEIQGLNAIQEYCNTNDLESLVYSNSHYKIDFTRKTYVMEDGKKINPADYSDFNFRVNYNMEEKLDIHHGIVKELLKNWLKVKKSFRYLCRSSFKSDKYPFIVDLSIVRTSTWNKETKRPLKTYTIKESNVFNNPVIYEIEAELESKSVVLGYYHKNVDDFIVGFENISKIILSGLQKTNFPISYKKQDDVMASLMTLIHGKEYDTTQGVYPSMFLGPSSKTLQVENIVADHSNSYSPNIRRNYLVTEKADGIRNLLYVAKDGLVYLINMNMNVIFTGAQTKKTELVNTILDGELILHDKFGKFINLFAAFDIYYLKGEDIRHFPFMKLDKDKYDNRLELMQSFINNVSLQMIVPSDGTGDDFKLRSKKFYPSESNKENMIFPACNLLLKLIQEGQFDYNTDGLIFTPTLFGVGSDQEGKAGPKKKIGWDFSLKWKPPEFNTIDFLVTTIKNNSNEDVVTPIFQDGMNVQIVNQFTQYKTLVLRCGFDEKNGYINPCQDLLEENWSSSHSKDKKDTYKPVRFYPSNPDDKEAGIAHIMLEEDSNGNMQMFTEEREVFETDMVVEFRYDMSKDKKWRWIPLRVRNDKTADYKQGLPSYGNDYSTANNNWYSIHYPVTKEMLSSGQNIPEIDMGDVYYNRTTTSSSTMGLRAFHNLYVKKKLIVNVSKKGDNLIDFACGKGGDLSKWIDAKLNFVFGVDISKDNLENRIDGACVRYLNNKKKMKEMPYATFVNGTSAKNIKNGQAMFNEKAIKITKSLFGIGAKTNIGKGIDSRFGIVEEGFNVSSCQFAIHYMFEDKETINNFLRNVSECTKLDGYFIGTTYDGKSVFEKLKSIPQGGGIDIFENGKKIWQIVKEYDNTTFENNSSCLGYTINVYQETINQLLAEYLVNFDYLVRLMQNYGFALIDNEEAKKMGFPAGSAMFEALFNQLLYESNNPTIKRDFELALNMKPYEKEISFLNRYFIFKKIRNVDAEKIMTNLMNELPDEVQYEEEKTQELQKTMSQIVKKDIEKKGTEKKETEKKGKEDKKEKGTRKKMKKAPTELIIEE